MRGGVDKRSFFVDDNFDVRRGVDDWTISIDDAFSVRREYDILFRNEVGLENTIAVLLYIRVP